MIERREIILDCFAGGGGASHGIERGLGRHVDYAVNHNAKALAVHMANHPRTVHLHENIRNLNPHSVLDIPVSTITTKDHHHLVYAFLMKYYTRGGHSSLQDPMPTQPTKDRFALVKIEGQNYELVDIGMRMLEPRELALATSFGPQYILAPDFEGKPLSKTDQVWMIGNAVPPAVAEALVRANFQQQHSQEIAA